MKTAVNEHVEQEEILYRDIMALGFTEDIQHDKVYEEKFGFPYAIIEKKLTKKIYLQWEKETRLCSMYRIRDTRECEIVAIFKIKNLDELKEIIAFFCDEKPYIPTDYA